VCSKNGGDGAVGLNVLDNTLHKELNECFLLHGTATSSVDAIARLGFDVRLSRDTALYGRGIYLAESLDKAFMYTGIFNARFCGFTFDGVVLSCLYLWLPYVVRQTIIFLPCGFFFLAFFFFFLA